MQASVLGPQSVDGVRGGSLVLVGLHCSVCSQSERSRSRLVTLTRCRLSPVMSSVLCNSVDLFSFQFVCCKRGFRSILFQAVMVMRNSTVDAVRRDGLIASRRSTGEFLSRCAPCHHCFLMFYIRRDVIELRWVKG